MQLSCFVDHLIDCKLFSRLLEQLKPHNCTLRVPHFLFTPHFIIVSSGGSSLLVRPRPQPQPQSRSPLLLLVVIISTCTSCSIDS